MKILGIDSSSISGCAGVQIDGKIVADGFVNNGLTHSQTLLPLINEVLNKANLKAKDIDLIGITKGPGSFTGLRIGMATAKGLAAVYDTKCVAISTLEAIAQTADVYNGIICAVMDARCKQVYNALFKCENGNLTRICEDRAISIEQLENELSNFNDKVILCGDGTEVCKKTFVKVKPLIADEEYRLPKANAICALSEKYMNDAVASEKLTPVYLRLPQASRELLKKKEVSK